MTAEIVSIRKEIIEETSQRLAIESIYCCKDELLDYAWDVYRAVGIRVCRTISNPFKNGKWAFYGVSNCVKLCKIDCCHRKGASSVFYVGKVKGVGYLTCSHSFKFCLDCLCGWIPDRISYSYAWYSKTEQLPWETVDEWTNRRLSELIDQLSTVIDDPT